MSAARLRSFPRYLFFVTLGFGLATALFYITVLANGRRLPNSFETFRGEMVLNLFILSPVWLVSLVLGFIAWRLALVIAPEGSSGLIAGVIAVTVISLGAPTLGLVVLGELGASVYVIFVMAGLYPLSLVIVGALIYRKGAG